MAILRRFANLFRRSAIDCEIDAELQAHIALRIDDNLAAGMHPEEARRDALLRFGNPTSTKEGVSAADATLALGGIWRNVRFALRQLRRSPGFALTAILALALGIGPNVAIFSIIWATFLAPLPYPNADQMVVVWTHFKGERIPSSGDDFAQFAAQSRSFQRLDFLSWRGHHLTNADHTEDEITGSAITPGFYTQHTQSHMTMGRDFRPDEGVPGNDHVVILTNRLWRERYHSDTDVLGKSILVDDQPYTIVGVLQPLSTDKNGAHFIIPVAHPPGVHSDDFGNIFGRLKPGVTLAQARAELEVIDRQNAAQRRRSGPSATTLTVEQLKNDWLDKKLQRNLWLLLASVGLVLLIACANVANLLLARGTSRKQELAVRSALGATRTQIFIQLLTESLMLALAGGTIGIATGWAIMKFSMSILPLEHFATEAEVGMNLPVLCFALIVTLLAGVLFGCAPGWQSSRLNLSETLKQGSRSVGSRDRTPTQSILVTVEIALALVLLAGAGMALHSFWNLRHIDLGFIVDRVMTGDLRPRVPSRGAKTSIPPPEQIIVQQHQLLNSIRAVPGVADASLATGIPLHGYDTFPFAVAGQPIDKAHPPVADFEAVTPGYFNTFGIRLVRGRFLSESDTLTSPLAVMVNETFVRRFLANADPLTQGLILQLPTIVNDGAPPKPPVPSQYQVVGVFHDVLDSEHLTDATEPEMYVSQWQLGWPFMPFSVRTVVDPAAVIPGLRDAVASAASQMVIGHIEFMQQVLDDQQTNDRFGMVLFGGFAFVALLLAAVGIYGVMAFAVAQRTHEVGVRMALGAHRSEVVALILRAGMRLALLGIAIGLAGAYGLGRLMHTTLYGVASADVGSLVAVAALLLAVAMLACWIPARRAARVDPMQALRAE
ncbi:MAG TPA: ABC transporter permease [Terracidiphilus sp.]|nr:ABC transporter permease [Terracidiphilus sp.]